MPQELRILGMITCLPVLPYLTAESMAVRTRGVCATPECQKPESGYARCA